MGVEDALDLAEHDFETAVAAAAAVAVAEYGWH